MRFDYNQFITNYREIDFEDYKYSYVILKPNSAIHFQNYLDELIEQKFEIINCFAIFDYETVNMVLHPDSGVLKYIMPLSRMYNDFHSNYAILILIGKQRISYPDFCRQVHRFKMSMRDKYHLDYVSFAFNISKVGLENEGQYLKIIKEDKEVPKSEFNEDGTYLVFLPNEIHSPDDNVEVTISELQLLMKTGILLDDNIIPKNIIESIKRYGTYSFLKDM